MIPSSVIDGFGPVLYNYSATVSGDHFYIEMVDVEGARDLFGPCALDEPYGVSAQVEAPSFIWLPLIVE